MTITVSKKEKLKAFSHVFDEHTLRAVFKLSSQNYFEDLRSPISIGKESNVFSASKGGEAVAVKVYRTSANFKKMYDYMAPDPRFTGLKRTKMNVIITWARKEYRNLLRARSARVRAPTPIAVNQNVLVLEFIGDNFQAAPQLIKSAPRNPQEFFDRIMKETRTLYHEARLIHADLSAFNILNHKEEPVLIDFSHAIDPDYPDATKYLQRDIYNVCTHFNKKLGLKTDAEEEFRKCTLKS